MLLTASSGATGCSAAYDPFGTPVGTLASGGNGVCLNDTGTTTASTGNAIWYRGTTRDGTTGAYQYGTRTYTPSISAFTTPDSYRLDTPGQDLSVGIDPLTANTYTYVNGDPENATDPDGHHFVIDSQDGPVSPLTEEKYGNGATDSPSLDNTNALDPAPSDFGGWNDFLSGIVGSLVGIAKLGIYADPAELFANGQCAGCVSAQFDKAQRAQQHLLHADPDSKAYAFGGLAAGLIPIPGAAELDLGEDALGLVKEGLADLRDARADPDIPDTPPQTKTEPRTPTTETRSPGDTTPAAATPKPTDIAPNSGGDIGAYRDSLPSRAAVGTGEAREFQIAHAGPTEFQISGGGQSIYADGIDSSGNAIETKFVGNAERSPFVPDSSIPDNIREMILGSQEDEFERYSLAINDADNPLVGLRVVTNSDGAAGYFSGLLDRFGIPGAVEVP